MPFLVRMIAKAFGRNEEHRPGTRVSQPPSFPDEPGAYVVDVYRDETALGRFVKRLSVSGAEKLCITYVEDDCIRIKMQRPQHEADWEAVVDELIDRCGLGRANRPAKD